MKLLTKEIINSIPRLYATESIPVEQNKIYVKFFIPTGAQSWFAVEGDPVSLEEAPALKDGSNDWRFFGWCDLGFGPGSSELGYFMLSELLSIKGFGGLGIERDMHFSGTLADVMN